jgi:hypothetical protein
LAILLTRLMHQSRTVPSTQAVFFSACILGAVLFSIARAEHLNRHRVLCVSADLPCSVNQ